MAASSWALSQISQILPLDESSLKEVLEYTSTLSKDASAEHLRNLLGTSPKALEFISSYNFRRESPKPEGATTGSVTPEPSRRPRKKKQSLNQPFAIRTPEDYGNVQGAYRKKDEVDYVAASSRSHKESTLANTLALSEKPDARQLPLSESKGGLSSPKKPPSASGLLISDLPNVRIGSQSKSRTSSPAPKTKVSIPGGKPMHGASSTLQDLDSAIRALELQTNPTLTNEPTSSRACDCLATSHPLLAAAPNCLNCGKIICVKEGIGPCTFCSHPLLSPSEINAMIRSLREERGREKMSVHNAGHKRADLATIPKPFTGDHVTNGSISSDAADRDLTAAQQHRDKLLAFQSQNAQRTHIIDEAADYETPSSGQSMWNSPMERAAQLKRQQKVLREQEWNAQPEWQKRQVVVSIDLVGGKAIRRMAEVEKPKEKEESHEISEMDTVYARSDEGGESKGELSRNPLLGELVRPVWKSKENTEGDIASQSERRKRDQWRRVQDDEDDNEAWILDGGVYGDADAEHGALGTEERAQG